MWSSVARERRTMWAHNMSAVDVFAFGVIMHEILTQQKPWRDAVDGRKRSKWDIEQAVIEGQCSGRRSKEDTGTERS